MILRQRRYLRNLRRCISAHAGGELGTVGQQSFSLTSAGVAVELEMVDFETEEPHTANAVASFTRIGGPVNSTLLGQTFQTRLNEQPFAPSGTLEFSTGDSFEMDAEHCLAVQFKNRSATHKLGGPKSGPVPAKTVRRMQSNSRLARGATIGTPGRRAIPSSRSSRVPKGNSMTSAGPCGTRSRARANR